MSFFRRKPKPPKPPTPMKDEDGYYYIEDGQDYASDEFETDSEDESYDNKDDANDDASGDNTNDTAVEQEKVVKGEAGNNAKANNESSSAVIGSGNGIDTTMNTSDAKKSAQTKESNQKSPVDNSHPTMNVNGGQLELEMDEENEQAFTESMQSQSNDATSASLNAGNAKDGAEDTQQPSSLHEKRSLLALAAEHDRVDILKAILQPNTNIDNTPLVQLLLNNRIVESPSLQFSQNDLEAVFIPPLHVAIASSSTNAASCLLRMGSNPSIRPVIPEDWKGPDWKDEKGVAVSKDGKWIVFHGKSAWELAFHSAQRGTIVKQDVGEEKKGWFGRKSSNANETPRSDNRIVIAPSKLEGIKHAFTAEALRAIGSDEVDRLAELLDSGLDTGSTERIEIGGKDLSGWCRDMDAVKCIDMLGAKYAALNDAQDDQDLVVVPVAAVAAEETFDDDDGLAYDVPNLRDLCNKLEESESLAAALSSILDNLAEEVSITQGLLMQHGDPSNTALLSQVRILKEKRAQVEDETTLWQYKMADRRAELDIVLIWWQKRGGSEDDIPGQFANYQTKQSPALDGEEELTNEEMKAKVKQASVQLSLSENKVKKLRASIADLAEESSRELEEVEELGLVGAVNLTRKLKEDVREKQEVLDYAIQQEAEVRARVYMVREMLENDGISQPVREMIQPPQAEMERINDPKQEESDDLIENVIPESPILQAMDDPNGITRNASSEESYDGDGSSDGSYSESDSYETDEDLTHSETIKQGRSNALVQWVDDEDLGLFAFKIWSLLQRMFGLSKAAIKQTAKATIEDVVNPRVMII